jgi:hypothetical protein
VDAQAQLLVAGRHARETQGNGCGSARCSHHLNR